MMNRSSVGLKSTVLMAGLVMAGWAQADARIDPQLAKRMLKLKPNETLQVVVTFKQSGPVTPEQINGVKAIGITKGLYMQTLPIMGVVATPAHVKALAKRKDVVSVFYNARLKYHNREARQVSGSARVSESPSSMKRAIPYSGRGVTVVVNDSGVDGNHPDLALGTRLVDNVQAAQNLSQDFVAGIVPVAHLKNQLNTDFGSGHGTHVAGTVGGSGVASNGLYRGAANGADLIGYGSGGVLLILDAVGGLDFAATNQFAYRNPIRLTQNSWGGSGKFDPTDPVVISTYELYKRGILTVFSAGNDGPGEDTHNPASQAPWVMSVGAGEKDGVLTSFSSRGKRGEKGDFEMPDGTKWTYVNEPTIVATGVDIISTRALSGALPATAAQQDQAALAPAHLPYYTHMSGTSMSTPHVSGVVALMLEANPNLSPDQVKSIIRATATNMGGRDTWEAGAGHLNAYAAVAMAAGLRKDYGATPNFSRSFLAKQLVKPGTTEQVTVAFSPVRGSTETKSFEVGDGVVQVAARTVSSSNPVGLVLTDPDGIRYGSSIALPVLGETITASGPGKKGTWTISMRGVGSVSGNSLDPAGVTDGYGVPETFTIDISTLLSGGFTGLDDVAASHPARKAVEDAVASRLVDGRSAGAFEPDALLTRGELAQYLVMGANVRQSLPFSGKPSFTDVAVGSPLYPFAEAAVAPGSSLRDLKYTQSPAMRLNGGKFEPAGNVSRADLAYTFVQLLGLEAQAKAAAANADVTALVDGVAVPLADQADIPKALRGHVQVALDQGVLKATVSGGKPSVAPNQQVTRAAYSQVALAFQSAYRAAED